MVMSSFIISIHKNNIIHNINKKHEMLPIRKKAEIFTERLLHNMKRKTTLKAKTYKTE